MCCTSLNITRSVAASAVGSAATATVYVHIRVDLPQIIILYQTNNTRNVIPKQDFFDIEFPGLVGQIIKFRTGLRAMTMRMGMDVVPWRFSVSRVSVLEGMYLDTDALTS